MDLTAAQKITPGVRDLRLQTLIRLRWLAVAGQAGTVLIVAAGLGFDLPLGPCFVLIALSVWLNMFLQLRYPASQRVTPLYAALLLGYDIAQLAGLLYLTGGLQNPFAILFLVPVMVSATALPGRCTFALASLVVGLATLLTFLHLPLPWHEGAALSLPFYYHAGVWVALIASLGFMALYTWRIAEEARQMSQALAATELVLAREQHLSALDGLAAAAAHELGTPLATISLVAKELLRDATVEDAHHDDLVLLKTQADRCRDILGKIASLGDEPDAMMTRMSVAQMVEEVVAPHRYNDKTIALRLRDATAGAQPVMRRNPGILYGLGNLVENAVDFAAQNVTITADWTPQHLVLRIGDDGPGFSPLLLERLGDPYVTTRPLRERRHMPESAGLGLGFFIAKTLLERSGGKVAIANRAAPAQGAVVEITWPRSALEAGGEW